MPRTAQQEINYRLALTKLVEAMETFVEVARRNGLKPRSIAWNYRAIFYDENNRRRHWNVTMPGNCAIIRPFNAGSPRKPRPRHPRK